MNINKCNLCKHKSEVGIYNLQMCITCSDNPFVIDERFDAKEVEIRPEKAGELWKFNQYVWFTYLKEGEEILMATCNDGDISQIDKDDKVRSSINPIHGKDKWTRLFPPVLTEVEMKADIRRMLGDEDNSVECPECGFEIPKETS